MLTPSMTQAAESDILRAAIHINRDNPDRIRIVPLATWLQKPGTEPGVYRYHLEVRQSQGSNRSTSAQSGNIPLAEIGEPIELSKVSHNTQADTRYDIKLVFLKNGQPIVTINDLIQLNSNP